MNRIPSAIQFHNEKRFKETRIVHKQTKLNNYTHTFTQSVIRHNHVIHIMIDIMMMMYHWINGRTDRRRWMAELPPPNQTNIEELFCAQKIQQKHNDKQLLGDDERPGGRTTTIRDLLIDNYRITYLLQVCSSVLDCALGEWLCEISIWENVQCFHIYMRTT